jgi:hypothetical protein
MATKAEMGCACILLLAGTIIGVHISRSCGSRPSPGARLPESYGQPPITPPEAPQSGQSPKHNATESIPDTRRNRTSQLLNAIVVPMPGNVSAPLRTRPGFDRTDIIRQLQPGTPLQLGRSITRPGQNSPNTWYEVYDGSEPSQEPLGWMNAEVLQSSSIDGPRVPCSHCNSIRFCLAHCL